MTEDKPKFKRVKMPAFYKRCAMLLTQYMECHGRISKLVSQGKELQTFTNGVTFFLKKLDPEVHVMEKVVADVGLLDEPYKMNKAVAIVIAWDLLSNGVECNRLQNPCTAAQPILQHKDQIITAYEEHKQSDTDGAPVLPRWVRINTLLTSVSDVKDTLTGYGWSKASYSPSTYEAFIEAIKNLKSCEYLEDFHVPGLLVFPPYAALQKTDLAKNNHIILQDKASCLPALIAGVTPGMMVVESCAAPGNKTMHLAALMKNKGKLRSTELDPERFEVLKKRVTSSGVKCAQFWNCDFLQVPHEEMAGVHTILVDPSCSNSGVTLYQTDYSQSQQRINGLQCIQRKLLHHALSVPGVQVVVYSTCSVHVAENEAVIALTINKFGDRFRLKSIKKDLAEWKNVGVRLDENTNEKYKFYKKVLRADAKTDLCHGFFIAKFVARQDGEVEEESEALDNSNKRTDTEEQQIEEQSPVHKKKKRKSSQ